MQVVGSRGASRFDSHSSQYIGVQARKGAKLRIFKSR